MWGGWGMWEEREKVTLATVPVVVDPFTVYTTSATVGWDGNGNPVDTEYVVRMSANSDFQSSFAPVEYEAGIHSATFTALTANTTYWVRAWGGRNRAEVLTEDTCRGSHRRRTRARLCWERRGSGCIRILGR
ncbi:MAG: hypothetical protein IPN19_02370 [Elusimicrobia bacterium]|nr:hypothetical protein [Elusimicrobiota bacterium]